MSFDDPDDEYDIPLNHRQPFGAGIKRKRINFVPQSTPSADATIEESVPSSSAHDAYLAIVLPQERQPVDSSQKQRTSTIVKPSSESPLKSSLRASHAFEQEPMLVCEICELPKPTISEQNQLPHESTLAHQVCLQHSHPPSSVDRRRKGLAYLESYGWDPDSRIGLGATGEGRLYPVRAEQKEDNRGIGAKALPKEEAKKPVRLSGKEFKKAQEEAKKREARMRDLVYGRDEVNKYLGIEL